MPSPSITATDLELILSETRPLWEEMRNQHLFLTGGTGFFGCWLLESFAYINRELRLNAQVTHIPEDYFGGADPLDPASVYAEGKRISEQMCALQSRASEVECKIARCFAFVGPHLPLDTNFAIGNFIRDTRTGGPIAIMGDGTPTRSYLYAADLAIWLWTILFRAPSMQAFNVGSEEAISIAKLAKTVVSEVDPSVSITIARQPSPNQAQQYVPRTQRAQQELGLRQTVNLAEAIRRTAKWHSQTQMKPATKFEC